MANVIPLIEVELDKVRHFRFDLNALASIEEKTGQSLLNGFDMAKLKMNDLRAFVWGGLIHEDAALTVEQVGSLIHMGNLADVSEKLREAFGVSAPPPSEDDAPASDSPVPGSTSGQSGATTAG